MNKSFVEDSKEEIELRDAKIGDTFLSNALQGILLCIYECNINVCMLERQENSSFNE